MYKSQKLKLGFYTVFGMGVAWYIWGISRKRYTASLSHKQTPVGGSVYGPAETERDLTYPLKDRVDEASFESFPASDSPGW